MNMKRQFKQSWNYVAASWRYIFFIIVVFFLSAIFGAVFHERLNYILDVLREIAATTSGLNFWQLVIFIFFNNLRAALFGMLGGIFFGIFPFFNAMTNGIVLGFVLQKVGEKAGILEFWRVLPHGIFELPAIFISLGLGVRIGMFIFSKNLRKSFVFEVKNGFQAFLFIILPLLMAAAIIEVVLIFVF